MIGGYVYNRMDVEIESRLKNRLKDLFRKIVVWDSGYLFFDKPFEGAQASCLASDELIVLSQDLFLLGDENLGIFTYHLSKRKLSICLSKGFLNKTFYLYTGRNCKTL